MKKVLKWAYFWRILVVFGVLNLINILVVDGGAGMEPVWIGIIGVSVILSFDKPLRWLFGNKYIKGLFWGGVSVFVVIEGLIISQSMALEIPANSDYLIVLGARVRGETPSLALQHRLDVAYDYLKRNSNTQAILTGGQGSGEAITEAEAMKRYLVQKGIPSERLLLENRATDTVENLTYSFEMLGDRAENPDVIVVTSSFHILRSKIIARELGWQVEGIGAQTLPFLIPTYYLREFFAVVAEIIF
ncbi:MAG: YdcF family protein [Cellulosilyticaceae bacterium]